MGEKKIRIPKWLVPLVILISLTGGVRLYSQFLSDEEEKKKLVEEKKDIVPENIALNIKAESVPGAAGSKCTIKVMWDLSPKYPGEYVVAKSNQIIDTVEKVRTARVVQTVKGSVKNTVIDSDCAPGSYYYVILSKNSITENTIELYRDSNYMSAPVIIDASGTLPMVSGIRAVETDNLKVRLTWDRVNKSAIFYTIYRSKQVINTESLLKESERLETLVDVGEYVDEGIATDVPYFYAVTAKALNGKDNPALIPDKNYTTAGALVTSKKVDQIHVKSINARTEKEAVLVTWKYSGTGGDAYYRLFRAAKQVRNVNEISSRDILRNVNIKDAKYMDAAVPPGQYFYGLVPGTGKDISSYTLVPGMNITRNPVVIKMQGEGKEKTVAEPDDIDRILKRTFFKGRYYEAIKELQNLVDAGGSEEVAAKAKLFIGRSNIEIGRFRKALDYLLLSDVNKYFPKDADFWVEFALTRIKNY